MSPAACSGGLPISRSGHAEELLTSAYFLQPARFSLVIDQCHPPSS